MEFSCVRTNFDLITLTNNTTGRHPKKKKKKISRVQSTGQIGTATQTIRQP
jgi:hypothetical protein